MKVNNYKHINKISVNSRYKQGIYDEKNISQKYFGPRPIYFRSSLELDFMRRLDFNNNVLKWTSESLAIPYISKEKKDGKIIDKKRTYFPDFLVILKSGRVLLIEVKPLSLVPLNETQIFTNPDIIKNKCKFNAAVNFCKSKGWEFKIITEHSINSTLTE